MTAPFYAHSQALVESTNIGAGTRVWAFAHILPKAQIGRDCNICDHVFIENDVVVGDRVTIKCGVQLWDGITVEDDVFIGPGATFTNDPFPRSKKFLDSYPKTTVAKGASIGANATILPGLIIGQRAMIGAGSVVTRSVPPNAVVVGNPGRIVGYVDSNDFAKRARTVSGSSPEDSEVLIEGARIIKSPVIEDLRGNLIAREVHKDIPFEPKRCFVVYDVPSKEIRGEHAHKKLHQLLICITGSVHCVLDNGKQRQEFNLDQPNIGLYIPPMVWGIQYKYSADAKLLVLASDVYDSADYIRDYNEYLRLVGA